MNAPAPNGVSPAATVAARAAAIASAAPVEAETDATAPTEPAPAAPAAPAKPEKTKEDPKVPPAPVDPAAADAAKARSLKIAEMEEKLAHAREQRKAQRIAEQARAERSSAQADRQAAAAERSKWEALRTGTFKETLQALGRDPRKAFEEMQREAIEANTPEGQIRAMRAEFERQLGEKLAPLETLQQELTALKKERAVMAQQAYEQRLEGAFVKSVQDPKYVELRTEYDDPQIFHYVQLMDQNPDTMYAAARKHGIRLTRPGQGFTMQEILDVLAAEQAAHDKGKQQRRDRLQATNPGHGNESTTRTVNGTVAPSNAGSTITNEIASTAATRSGRRLSRQERIDAEIKRLEQRR